MVGRSRILAFAPRYQKIFFMKEATFEMRLERMARMCGRSQRNKINGLIFMLPGQRSLYKCPMVAGQQENQQTHSLRFLAHIL